MKKVLIFIVLLSIYSIVSAKYWKLKNMQTELLVDSDKKGKVFAWESGSDRKHQRWDKVDAQVKDSSNNYKSGVNFKNSVSGLCLDSGDLVKKNKGNVYAMSCNGGMYQLWIVKTSSNGVTIQNAKTGLYLDSNKKTHSTSEYWAMGLKPGPEWYDGDVYTHVGNGGNYQNWEIQERD